MTCSKLTKSYIETPDLLERLEKIENHRWSGLAMPRGRISFADVALRDSNYALSWLQLRFGSFGLIFLANAR